MRGAYLKWIVISGCWSVWGVFNASRLLTAIPDATWSMALAYAMPDAVIWALLTPMVLKLAATFPVRPGNVLARIPLHLIFALVTALTHTLLDSTQAMFPEAGIGFWQLFTKITRHTVHLNVLVYIVIVCLYQYLHHYWKTRDEQRKNAELRAQLSDARLASLEAQLRPHFLFNTLNTISGLIESNPASGPQVVCPTCYAVAWVTVEDSARSRSSGNSKTCGPTSRSNRCASPADSTPRFTPSRPHCAVPCPTSFCSRSSKTRCSMDWPTATGPSRSRRPATRARSSCRSATAGPAGRARRPGMVSGWPTRVRG